VFRTDFSSRSQPLIPSVAFRWTGRCQCYRLYIERRIG